MTHYVLNVPVSYKKGDEERTRYSRVGAVFENARRDTGEIVFPVGATELVAFPPKAAEAEDAVTE